MLNYADIFAVFVELMQNAIPIGVFLWLLNVTLSLFFSLAFPKAAKFRRGDF